MTDNVLAPVGRVAILAGGGDLPLMIADSVQRRGGQVEIVAIQGEADQAVTAYPHTWVNLGQVTRMLRALQGPANWTGPNAMVIAGAVTRPDLMKIRPDFGLIRVAAQILRLINAGGDDALLTNAIRIFERQGLTVVGVHDVAPELLIGSGVLGRIEPDALAERDLAVAGQLLASLGGLDIGQAIVVADGQVLAIEGAEGTDRMLARLARLPPRTNAVLLKAPKPRQERRVDLPTIGLRTVSAAKAAGVRGIAVVAGASIGLQRAEMIVAADAEAMFVTGLAASGDAAGAAGTHVGSVVCHGKRRPSDRDLADVRRGADAVLRLATFATGEAAAVVRGHVLGLSAMEGPLGLLERVANLSQWGLERFQKKRGACVVRVDGAVTTASLLPVLARVASAGFAGLAMVMTDTRHIAPALIRMADAHNLFLVSLQPH